MDLLKSDVICYCFVTNVGSNEEEADGKHGQEWQKNVKEYEMTGCRA